MDRAQIKSLAKEKIKGNLWKLWKPLLIIMVVYGVLAIVLVKDPETTSGSIISSILSLVFSVFVFGYDAYVLSFSRGEEVSFNTITNCIKEKWLSFLVTSILVGIFVCLWSILFVIPGIVKAIAYSMVTFILIDTELSNTEAITESKIMMEGHKWEYFVFQLSFIGWELVGVITLGIAYIWVLPYITVSECIYYDNLRGNADIVTTKVENDASDVDEEV